MTLFILALSTLLTGFVPQQHPAVDTLSAVHYRVYQADGTPSSLAEIETAMGNADVVFIGESHNDPIVHYLQRNLLEKAYGLRGDGNPSVAVSMEMFTRDVQFMVDEYLDDLVTESQFLAASEPWDNYGTDYRPLVEFAKQHDLDVIAANAPRRYTNRVTRLGRESLTDLSENARSFLAPLPYAEASAEYADQFAQAMREAMEEMAASRDETPPEPEVESCCECDCSMMAKMMRMHHGDDDAKGMEHGDMGGMEHGEMEGMEHGEMEGMEHGEMEGMEHGEMGEMNHADMMRMHHGDDDDAAEGDDDAAEGMEHGDMEGMDHGDMKGMDHGDMEGMEHGDMEGMEQGESEDAEVQEMEMESEDPMGAVPAHGVAAAMPSQSNMLDSQSLWDATMAYSISEYLKSRPGSQVIHVVGSFHVNRGTGIPEHLARYAPSSRSLIISVEPAADIATFDSEKHANLGDFVILSDESLPRTFDSTP